MRVPLEDGLTATLSETHGINVEAAPHRGEGMVAFTVRLCGEAGLVSRIAEANGGSETLHAGARYTIPFDLLSPELQLKAVQALFPAGGSVQASATRTASPLPSNRGVAPGRGRSATAASTPASA